MYREEDPALKKNCLEVGYTRAGEIGRFRGQKICSPRPTPIARSDGTVLRSPPPLEVRGRALILGSRSRALALGLGSRLLIGCTLGGWAGAGWLNLPIRFDAGRTIYGCQMAEEA